MFIEWLREGLKQPGKTQRGLADALGVAPSAVSRLLNRERELLASEIEKAAVYLGTPPPMIGRATVEPVKTIPVTHSVARGSWREGTTVTLFNPATIPVVYDLRYKGMDQWAARLDPDQRYVICVTYSQARARPIAGDLVLIERTKADLVEHSLCTVIAKADGSLSLRTDTEPYVEYRIDGPDLRIVGLCIGRFQLF